jgi:hypothetical protein
MPTATAEPVITTSPTDRSRKRWTRTEFKALENSGLLAGQHLELIGGELLNKMGKAEPKRSKRCGAAFIPASKTSSRPT